MAARMRLWAWLPLLGLLGCGVGREPYGEGVGASAEPLLEVKQQAKLAASDAVLSTRFGLAVAVSGDTAIVGEAGSGEGVAYIYARTGGVWSEQAKLLPDKSAPGDSFGAAVALSGDTAVVGSLGDGTAGPMSGAVFVFTRKLAVWTQEAKLIASDAASDARFGTSVALSGDTLAVGSFSGDLVSGMGRAYAFTRKGTKWSQEASVAPDDSPGGDAFGAAVAISADTLAVGASGATGLMGATSGATYLFKRDADAWVFDAKLTGSGTMTGDMFGASVSIDGETLLVGAPSHDDVTVGPDKGAAYVFVRSVKVWQEQSRLSALSGQPSEQFGASVALSGDQALVGVPYDSQQTSWGGAVIGFTRSSGAWSERGKIMASVPVAQGLFGASVALSSDTAVVGAPTNDETAPGAGLAYVYVLKRGQGDQCAAALDCDTGFCVDGVCCDTACGGDPGDCQACSTAANAADNGVCGPVIAGVVCRMDGEACAVCDGAATVCPMDSSVADCPEEPDAGSASSSSGGRRIPPPPLQVDGGCGCRVAGGGGAGGLGLAWIAAAGLTARRGRKRSAR